MITNEYTARVNCLVAKHAFGWTECEVANGDATGHGPDTRPDHWDFTPDYARDIAAAWPLAAKYRVHIEPASGVCWLATIFLPHPDTVQAFAPTAPLAICLAVLKHLGAELPVAPEGASK